MLEYVFCMFTVKFTAHQLHAQSTSLTTNHRDDSDVLSHNGGVEKVCLCAVVINVTHKNLKHKNTGN